MPVIPGSQLCIHALQLINALEACRIFPPRCYDSGFVQHLCRLRDSVSRAGGSTPHLSIHQLMHLHKCAFRYRNQIPDKLWHEAQRLLLYLVHCPRCNVEYSINDDAHIVGVIYGQNVLTVCPNCFLSISKICGVNFGVPISQEMLKEFRNEVATAFFEELI